MHFTQTLLALCTAASAVLAAPTSLSSSKESKLEARQTTFNGKSLSILPLGDSITVSIVPPQSTIPSSNQLSTNP
jgi:hypothetical protein